MFRRRFDKKQVRAAIRARKEMGETKQQVMDDMVLLYAGNRGILKLIAEVYNEQHQIGQIKVNYKDQK